MSNHQVVILANSVKHHQHCVAGKIVNTHNWVRLVSDEQGCELTHEQAKCQNPHGKFNVKPLQKVAIGIARHVPLINQPENYLIDGSTWQQNYRIDENELVNYLDRPGDIWGTGDRVNFHLIRSGQFSIQQSLYLIQVEELNLFVNNYNKRRARFIYNGSNYELAVTDPNFDNIISNSLELKNILCISLGEEFEGNCFKLIATIF